MSSYKTKLNDITTFIFDVDGDGELSPDELLDVVCRRE